jgi:uncharacterized protein (DUF2164 family)
MAFAVFEKQQISNLFSESLEFSQTDIESEISSVKAEKDSDFISSLLSEYNLHLSFSSWRIRVRDHLAENRGLIFISLRGPPKHI